MGVVVFIENPQKTITTLNEVDLEYESPKTQRPGGTKNPSVKNDQNISSLL